MINRLRYTARPSKANVRDRHAQGPRRRGVRNRSQSARTFVQGELPPSERDPQAMLGTPAAMGLGCSGESRPWAISMLTAFDPNRFGATAYSARDLPLTLGTVTLIPIRACSIKRSFQSRSHQNSGLTEQP